MSWQPEWNEMQHLGDFTTVGEALDRYYDPAKLDLGESREAKIRVRERRIAVVGWTCLVHPLDETPRDDATGAALWARKTDAGTVAIYRG